jgi:hypothetical protein
MDGIDVTLASSGSLLLGQRRGGHFLMRVLGLYVAAAAGTIQLLDIVVDRVGLPDRVLAFVIVLAVIGVPIVAAAALMLDIASSERRRPSPATASPAGHRGHPALPMMPQAPPPGIPEQVPRVASGEASDLLPQRLGLALSCLRIAELHEAAGEAAEARVHRKRFEADIASIIADLQGMLEG